MRTIKFRGKNYRSNKWKYGSLLQNHNLQLCTIKQMEDLGLQKPLDELMVDPATVGQFTSFHDCKDREVYEGDIIQSGLNRHFIGFDKRKGAFVAYYYHQSGQKLNMDISQQWFNKVEIIGNIYDNPDLLKGGEK